MRAHWKSWLVFALLVGTTAYCVAEQVMVYTTYPSPLGVYQALRVTADLGVGTMTPGQKLDVYQNDTSTVLASIRNNSATLWAGINAAGEGQVGTLTPSSKLQIIAAGQNRITIDPTAPGVGIGTASPQKALHIRASGLGPDGGSLAGITIENSSGNRFFLNTWDGVNRFSIGRPGVGDDVVIADDGDVGIGKIPSLQGDRLEIKGRTTTGSLPGGIQSNALHIYNSAELSIFKLSDTGGLILKGGIAMGQDTFPGSGGGRMLSVQDNTQDWQIVTYKTGPVVPAQVLIGSNDSAALFAGWTPITSTPAPLVLQPQGGNVGINFFGLPGNPLPRRPLDVWGEIVAINRVTLARDAGTATSTWSIDNSSTVPGSDVFRIFRQDNIDVAGQEYLKILSAVPILFPGGGVQIAGNLAIGDNVDVYRLRVNGNTYINGSLTLVGGSIIPADIAENMDCPDCEAGDVVVVDPEHDHQLTRSTHAYDPAFAGVISTKPALNIGGNRGESAKPLALAGQVPCKVTAENGPIKRGDLLVTSSKPGHAMRADSENIKPGTLIGKALEPLAEGEGTILVLITGG